MKRIRRLPTILGILILLIGIGVGVVVIRQAPHLLVRAGPEVNPKEVNITNITDNSFTVSWITDAPTSGYVKYGVNNSLTLTAKDDRDQASGETGNFNTHYVTVKNLNPAIKYYFKIGSGTGIFGNNDQSYQLTTAPAIRTAAPANDTAYGTVVDQSGSPARGVIVYLSLANAILQSALTTSSGVWSIPLNLTRSEDLSTYLVYDREASIESIKVQGASSGVAEGQTTTKRDSPIPDIILGRNFDYVTSSEGAPPGGEEEEDEEAANGEDQQGPGFNLGDLGATPPATVSSELTIVNPEDKEEVSTAKPEVIGTGPVGETIEVVIESPTAYNGKVLVDSLGKWQWTPPANLEAGEHTITASYTDESGQKKTVFHSFVVLAAGEDNLPSYTATPSGEAVLSPTPTPSPKPSPTPTPRTSMPSTEGGVPSSGDMMPTFLVFLIGSALVVLGFSSRLFLKE